MPSYWIYGRAQYDTQAAAEAAVTEMKNKLDNCPTNWCVIKEATPDGNGGYILGNPLTDDQVNNLNNDALYNVWSIRTGENLIAVDAATVASKIAEWRVNWAQIMEANQIFQTWEPTNEDMSGYVK
jgi:hypothetical protein